MNFWGELLASIERIGSNPREGVNLFRASLPGKGKKEMTKSGNKNKSIISETRMRELFNRYHSMTTFYSIIRKEKGYYFTEEN